MGKDPNGGKRYTVRPRGQDSEKAFSSVFGIKLVDMVEIYPVLLIFLQSNA